MRKDDIQPYVMMMKNSRHMCSQGTQASQRVQQISLDWYLIIEII